MGPLGSYTQVCLGPCFTDAKSVGRKELGLGKGTEERLGGVTWEGMLTVQEQHDEWPLTSGWELLSAMAWPMEVTSIGEAPRELVGCGQFHLYCHQCQCY